MHILEIRDVKNKGWKKVWESPFVSTFGFDAEEHCTSGTHRVYIEDEDGELLWHLVVFDEDLDSYWEESFQFSKQHMRENPDAAMVTSSIPEIGRVSLQEYVSSMLYAGIAEDVLQLPFIDETKELSELVESGKYRWSVSPDIGVLWSEEDGLEWDT